MPAIPSLAQAADFLRRPLLCAWLGLMLLPQTLLAAVTIDISTVAVNPVAGGGAFSINILVTNPDGVGVNNVVMTYSMPSGMIFQNNTIVGTAAGSFSCLVPAVGENGSLVCRAPNMPAGTNATMQAVMQIPADVAGGVRTNIARVIGSGLEATDSVQFTVVNDAQLTLSMSASPTGRPGATVAYRFAVQNSGSSSAINVFVGSVLPAGTRFQSFYGSGDFAGSCSLSASNSTLSCNPARVRSGLHFVTLVVSTEPNLQAGTLNASSTLNASVGAIAGSPATASTNITP
jgi:uncharacterized repeat protein (TIGR01451 family)